MSPLKIADVACASNEEWDSITIESGNATFFHTRAWHEASRLVLSGIQPAAMRFRFSDGCNAVVPYTKQRMLNGLIVRRLSSPFSTYGGGIGDRSFTEEHLGLVSTWYSSQSTLSIRSNPVGPDGVPRCVCGNETTRILDCSLGMQQLSVGFSRQFRTGLDRSRDAGVAVSEARTTNEWLDYYSIYQQTVVRWQQKGASPRVVYPRSLFLELFRLQGNGAHLFLAKRGERTIAGILCLHWNSHLAYWHGASLDMEWGGSPNHALFHYALSYAVEKKIHWFDLMPSGGYAGVERFKEGLGGFLAGVPTIVRSSSVELFLQGFRRRFATLRSFKGFLK